MKIKHISCFRLDVPLKDGGYMMSHGRKLDTLDTTVVKLTADDGRTGWGEACTLGSNYIEAFPDGVRAGVAALAPHVLGRDVLDVRGLVDGMDAALLGQNAAKSAVDAAAWDLRGKLLEQPVATLLGGIQRSHYPVFSAIPVDSPEAMAQEAARLAAAGRRHWQLKLGDDPTTDAARVHAVHDAIDGSREFFTCDANQGWTRAESRRFLTRTESLDVWVEQPTIAMSDLAELRNSTARPIMADECVRDIRDLVACARLGAADGVNIKPARVGGITKAALLRDTAQALGWHFMIDDPKGTEVAAAAVGHLAASAGSGLLCASYPALHLEGSRLRSGGVQLAGGTASLSEEHGLGIDVDESGLGEPQFELAL
ncbi:mandelate racemase/muconate lactonizing enzyme family protein [Mycobacterium sp. NPDC003449]